ncbi:MAG: gliding motility protein GldM [Flammeovirgaceae bacterium]
MAGGAKETPRQRMIGMMYLVLTALLALQISNAVLDKFVFIDESLKHSVELTMGQNEKVIGGIREVVAKNGNRPRDTEVLKKAEMVKEETSKVIALLAEMRNKIVEVSGGRDPKTGEYLGAKDYDKQMAYTIGEEGKKNGKAYELQKVMNGYIDQLNQLMPKDSTNFKLDYIALDAKDILDENGKPMYANNEDQKNKDFAYLNFDHTPTVACLAILSQMKSEVARAEAKALEKLAAQVGADQLKFDKIFAVVRPESKVVAAGTKYVAEMFIAAASSSVKPRMTYNGASIKVEDGKGKIEFVASADSYNAELKAEKSWKGTITIATPFGDTTLVVDEKYVVSKPVIQVQAAAVSALYFNCGNELNVQVPSLGENYDPSFTADGAEAIKGAKKGFVTVVPDKAEVALTVFSGGNKIGTEKFRVKPVPKPEIKLFVAGKAANLKEGHATTEVRTLGIKAVPDGDFASFLPKDARYRVAEWDITLARGKRAIKQFKGTGEQFNANEIASEAKPGDRIVIEVKKVQRMNFKDRVEEVKGVNDIITIPLN